MAVFSTFFQQAVQIRLEVRPLDGSSLARQPTAARLTQYHPPNSKVIHAADFVYAFMSNGEPSLKLVESFAPWLEVLHTVTDSH